MKIQGINPILADLSDIELFVALCNTQDDAAIYQEFVSRFLPHVLEECQNYCKRRGLDNDLGTQIAHDTFENARRYKSFRTDEIKTGGDRKAVLVYLYRIAYNLFRDHYKKERRQANNYGERKDYFAGLLSSANEAEDPAKLLRIKDEAVEIMKKLSPNERKVLLTDLEYKRNQGFTYLPDEVSDDLAADLGVAPASIRKIRERAIKKIKKAIDEINQQPA